MRFNTFLFTASHSPAAVPLFTAAHRCRTYSEGLQQTHSGCFEHIDSPDESEPPARNNVCKDGHKTVAEARNVKTKHNKFSD